MMLCRDIRRRWMQYGENRKLPAGLCIICNRRDGVEIDHIERVGARPRTIDTIVEYIKRMLFLKCQRLCKECHATKTKEDRKAIKQTI